MYELQVVELINKALRDELSAASSYSCMSQTTENGTLASELMAHASEEFGHYNQIIGFVYAHGLEEKVNFSFDLNVANQFPSDTFTIIEFTQGLETRAMEDYRQIALLARENNDLETEAFFMGLMAAEQTHFDDLARYNGGRRVLRSFKDMVGTN